MAVTEVHIATLRRMVAEPDATTYDDQLLQDFIEARAVRDVRGVEPFWYDTSTTPPTKTERTEWIPKYDLNAAAADVWDEKAANVACDYDFNGDGSSLSRSQLQAQYLKQSSYFRARAVPGSMQLLRKQRELTQTLGTGEDVVVERVIRFDSVEELDRVN